MTDQPEALRVATKLDEDFSLDHVTTTVPYAARLLREQHEEIKRLREALRTALDASWNGPLPDWARDEAAAALQEQPR